MKIDNEMHMLSIKEVYLKVFYRIIKHISNYYTYIDISIDIFLSVITIFT